MGGPHSERPFRSALATQKSAGAFRPASSVIKELQRFVEVEQCCESNSEEAADQQSCSSAQTCQVGLISVKNGAALCLGDDASGGNFNAADIVGLLVSSAVNGSLSTLDLSSPPGLARNSSQACKSRLPNVLSQTLGLPSDSPWLVAVDSLCDGLTARVQNASTPEQLVLAASTMVKDAMAAVSNAASAEQVALALAQIAFGADAAGNLTAVANISYQAVAAAAASAAHAHIIASSETSEETMLLLLRQMLIVKIGGGKTHSCLGVVPIGGIVSLADAALASLTANSNNLVASELVRLIYEVEAFVEAKFVAKIELPICSPAVIADILRRFAGSALMPHGCNITDYDSIVACLLSNNASAGGGSPLATAVDRLRNAFVYALLTGLQNSTRALTDLALLTGVSAFLNSA